MRDPMDLTGAWFGHYSYPGTLRPAVAFIASIEEAGGLIAGTTSERAEGDELHAILRGSREGTAVAFTKAYDGAGRLAHAVEYEGDLDEDGGRVAGTWRLEGWAGKFEMTRGIVEETEEEALSAEVELEDDVARTDALVVPEPG